MSETNFHVWAFDPSKASLGEAVRQGNTFLHKASLLIPYDFAETKSAANRRRMWRTREGRAKGLPLEEPLVQAGLARLRPVLVTVLATVGD